MVQFTGSNRFLTQSQATYWLHWHLHRAKLLWWTLGLLAVGTERWSTATASPHQPSPSVLLAAQLKWLGSCCCISLSIHSPCQQKDEPVVVSKPVYSIVTTNMLTVLIVIVHNDEALQAEYIVLFLDIHWECKYLEKTKYVFLAQVYRPYKLWYWCTNYN